MQEHKFLVPTILFGFLIVFGGLPPAFAQDSVQPIQKEILVLPHVEANDDFFTGLSLLNTGEVESEVRLIAYNQTGRVIGEIGSILLSPGERYLNSVADIFGYEPAQEISWIKAEHTGALIGFGLLGNEGQLARIPLQQEGKERLILSYVVSGNGLFTHIYLLNIGLKPAQLTLTAHDSAGERLKSVLLEQALFSRQKFISSVTDLFGPEISQETSWIKIKTDGRLMGLALVGASDRLVAMPME